MRDPKPGESATNYLAKIGVLREMVGGGYREFAPAEAVHAIARYLDMRLPVESPNTNLTASHSQFKAIPTFQCSCGCQMKEPHTHLVNGQSCECEKGY